MTTNYPRPITGRNFYEDVQIVRNAGYSSLGTRNFSDFPAGHKPSHSIHYGHQCRHLYLFEELKGYMTLDSGD